MIHKGIEFNYKRHLCGSDEVAKVKEVKLFITAVAQLNDDHLLIVSNENIGQIYLINDDCISLIKEIKLSSKFILVLKKSNYLFSSEGNNKHEDYSLSSSDHKKSSFILSYDKTFSFSNMQKIDIPSNFAVESNDGRIFVLKKFNKNIHVLKENFKNKYEKIYTISSTKDIYGKPFVYKDKYLIYLTEHELMINDLNEYKIIKSFDIEFFAGNGEMRAVKENILVVAINRGFSLYNMEKLEFIKYITPEYDNILSKSLYVLYNGILLVGFSSSFIGVYDINEDFKEIERWHYICDGEADFIFYFQKEGNIAVGTINYSQKRNECIYIHSVKRLLKREEQNFWDLPFPDNNNNNNIKTK